MLQCIHKSNSNLQSPQPVPENNSGPYPASLLENIATCCKEEQSSPLKDAYRFYPYDNCKWFKSHSLNNDKVSTPHHSYSNRHLVHMINAQKEKNKVKHRTHFQEVEDSVTQLGYCVWAVQETLSMDTHSESLMVTVSLLASFSSWCSGNHDWYWATWGLSKCLPKRSWK